MKIMNILFGKKTVTALPDAQLIEQIVNSVITRPPSNLLKDHALPKDWTHVDYTFWIKEVLPDGSIAAEAVTWATSQRAPRQKYAVNSDVGLIVTQLYGQMHDRNQTWSRCDLTITRHGIDKSPQFNVTFSQEVGTIPY